MGNESRRAEAFARALAEIYGDALVSVVLYGSAARNEYQVGVSDLNILVLLETVDPATLRRGSEAARVWVADGNPLPLLLSPDELHRSLDTFPIEYSDIRDAHRVLHGADAFANLEIDVEHLRLQCEHELKSKLLQLRERYLLVADNPIELAELMVRSVSTFLVLFRSLLRAAGEPVPKDPADVIGAVATLADFAPQPMWNVLRVRNGGGTFRPSPEDPIVTGYLDAVRAAVEYVDGMVHGGRTAISNPGL